MRTRARAAGEAARKRMDAPGSSTPSGTTNRGSRSGIRGSSCILPAVTYAYHRLRRARLLVCGGRPRCCLAGYLSGYNSVVVGCILYNFTNLDYMRSRIDERDCTMFTYCLSSFVLKRLCHEKEFKYLGKKAFIAFSVCS